MFNLKKVKRLEAENKVLKNEIFYQKRTIENLNENSKQLNFQLKNPPKFKIDEQIGNQIVRYIKLQSDYDYVYEKTCKELSNYQSEILKLILSPLFFSDFFGMFKNKKITPQYHYVYIVEQTDLNNIRQSISEAELLKNKAKIEHEKNKSEAEHSSKINEIDYHDPDIRQGITSNIAMAFKDCVHQYKKKHNKKQLNNVDLHLIANEAAENFYQLWIS